MRVLKFGGTSVGSADMLGKVCRIVRSAAEKENVIVVVSALSGVTNKLERLAAEAIAGQETMDIIDELAGRHDKVIKALIQDKELNQAIASHVHNILTRLEEICQGVRLVGELTDRTRARILSAGEIISYSIVAAFFESQGLECIGVDSRELILTKGDTLSATVLLDETYDRIASLPEMANVVVVPGFIARSTTGTTSTLGRGGSDYTAALIAAGCAADVLEIWTDVSGVMTANPRIVRAARPIAQLSYEEAMELSYFGAKVIYPPTIQPLVEEGIPIVIKNTLHPEHPGTLITDESGDDGVTVKGISSVPDVALITVSGSGMIGVPGTAGRLFTTLSDGKLNILFITQSSSEHTITLGISEQVADLAVELIDAAFELEIERGMIDRVEVESGLSLVAAVGEGMKERPGVSGQLFGLLGENGVNIRAIAQGSTERNVSFVINADDTNKALNAIHEGFFLSASKVVHIFNIGIGNVGGAMLSQLAEQAPALKENQHLDMRLAGLANSRNMKFSHEGIDLNAPDKDLGLGSDFTPAKFVQSIQDMNARNSVFVDNTGSAAIASLYESLLARSVHVVTSNKVAASSEMSQYLKLKALARARGVQFRYETNVAAGLPVINTIRDMRLTGDRITRIEAVLSGSLNYVFNQVAKGIDFSIAVEQARELGLTEPDPGIDLSGLDVKRKILILAREAGFEIEMDDVETGKVLPEGIAPGTSWKELRETLRAIDSDIKAEYETVSQQNQQWRFMATFDNGKAKVGLETIDQRHPAWVLEGKDNLVLIYSNRYDEQPMVVKGAGAGPEVTASGVLADILRIVNG